MLNILTARWQQGHRTIPFPKGEATVPDRLRGRPVVDQSKCPVGCRDCATACPTRRHHRRRAWGATGFGTLPVLHRLRRRRVPQAIQYTPEFRLATRTRRTCVGRQRLKLAAALDKNMRRLFGRSLKLRQVSAGGCNRL